jgi:hypothetical protein
MSDADNTSENGTLKSGDGSSDSPLEIIPTVPSPEQQPKESSPPSSLEIPSSSVKTLTVKGGSLAEISSQVAKDLTVGMPEDTQLATAKFIKQNSNGFVGALAMKCKGLNCAMLDVCPLYETNQALPIGKACPFEQGIVQTWVNKHLISLGIDDVNSPENSFDMDILYELAANELIKWKAAQHISQRGQLIEEKQVSASMQGDAIFGDVLSPAVELLEVHTKITMKLRDALLATRKAQIQAGQDMSDPSKKASDLAETARRKAMERLGKTKVKDADFEVKDN